MVWSTCDNKHTLASLGQTEILGVEASPSDCAEGAAHITKVRPPSPWRLERNMLSGQCSQKAAEGVVVGVEDSGDVFPQANSGRSSTASTGEVDGFEDLDIG